MDEKHTHSYIGRMPCGCVMACVIDMANKMTAKAVSDMIQDGMTVERVTMEKFRAEITKEPGFFDCPHGKEAESATTNQPALFPKVEQP